MSRNPIKVHRVEHGKTFTVRCGEKGKRILLSGGVFRTVEMKQTDEARYHKGDTISIDPHRSVQVCAIGSASYTISYTA